MKMLKHLSKLCHRNADANLPMHAHRISVQTCLTMVRLGQITPQLSFLVKTRKHAVPSLVWLSVPGKGCQDQWQCEPGWFVHRSEGCLPKL